MPETASSPEQDIPPAEPKAPPIQGTQLIARSVFGGFLMGLANLVPGISGGTMLLAAGVYPTFIESLADITRFKFRFRAILVLCCVALSAGVGILLLAGTLKELVVHQRWIMYSLFIGLTLGGVPLVWKLAKPISPALIVSALVALALMIQLAVWNPNSATGAGGSNFMTLGFAGLLGASAMILPGLSGGYLLLLIGQYVPILNAIDQFKDALTARDLSAAMEPALSVLLPVGIGVVLGIVIVGNLLQWTLRRYRQITLGILLGLLVGSTAGLWPFQVGVAPEIGDVVKNRKMTAASIEELDPEDWPTQLFKPSLAQAGGSLLLVVLGLGITLGVTKIGGDEGVGGNEGVD